MNKKEKKEKEFNMIQNHNLSYDGLLEISKWGVFAMNIKGTSVRDDRWAECKPVDGAIWGGKYVGSPGKDIYLMLPSFKDAQMEELSEIISNKFPSIAPQNHLNIAAFVRFIYGQFEKNGILRSDKDMQRMQEEKPDWALPRKFLSFLKKKFEEKSNFYGLTILCEMEGHRLGDEVVLYGYLNKIEDMEDTYNKALEYAYKCKSYKHLFTPSYWSARYFMKFNDKKKALKYAKLTIGNADEYCPDSRQSYIDKLLTCIKYIKKNDSENWEGFYNKYRKSKNRCVKRTFKLIKE